MLIFRVFLLPNTQFPLEIDPVVTDDRQHRKVSGRTCY